jgi:hypothetical protein
MHVPGSALGCKCGSVARSVTLRHGVGRRGQPMRHGAELPGPVVMVR